MADELSYKPYLTYTKNGVKYSVTEAASTFTVAGDHSIHATQEIGTAAENIGKGEITTIGWAVFHNMDDTNFIEIGFDDSGFKSVIKILAGEWSGPVRMSQATPQAKADTAACDLDYYFIEA